MKILLIDIETAPHKVYTWGLWKQNVAINQIEEPGYTLSWAAKWYKDKETKFASIFHDGKHNMLDTIYQLMEEADVIVHYNGTSFDIPTLNKEFLMAGWTAPSPYKQVDLLKVVRKQFRFPSNKLSYISSELGIGGKVNHKGMELWRECMAGDANSWETMKAYNIQDVNLLEKAYPILLPWISNHPNHGLYNDSDTMVCPNCNSHRLNKRGMAYTKTLTYQRYVCLNCGTWSREKITNTDKEKRKQIIVGV